MSQYQENRLIGQLRERIAALELQAQQTDRALEERNRNWAEAVAQRDEANARAAVCLNFVKAMQMVCDGKITETTFASISSRLDADLQNAVAWYAEFNGTALKQLSEVTQQRDELLTALEEIAMRADYACEWARVGELCHGDTYDLRKASEAARAAIRKAKGAA